VRFGVYAPTFGEYGIDALVELAREAEANGWDGFFIWDHVVWAPDGSGLADTTVALTAIALATEKIRFGALVTPLARRRPWKLAKETATLDRLSGGRLVVGAGLGARGDLEPVGEGRDPRELAAVLDEGLDVLAALWSAEPVTYAGEHFRLEGARVQPAPQQRPRIPIWIAGFWPNKPPMRRAARWDGVLPLIRGSLLQELSPQELRACVAYVREHRETEAPFDVVAFRSSPDRTSGTLTSIEEAGATWWIESVNPLEESLAEFRARVAEGPPVRA
jgi:alkanesulfonate monooxygenase SsuD/methylene tetrahydromethanopterin reductase-like flavin-dependent oxidoreductase (luciferase family)